MRVLVTGGGGLPRLPPRRAAAVGKGSSPFVARRRDYDLTVRPDTARLFEDARPELVFHLAAEVGGIGANRANPGRYWYANLNGSTRARAGAPARRREGRDARHDLRVPEVRAGAVPRGRPLERLPEETNAPYGIAKKALLVGAQAYRQQYGMNAIYLLPVNLYGPRDNFDLETLACHPRADPEDARGAGARRRARSCSGATGARRASSSTSRTASRGSGSPRSVRRRRAGQPRHRGRDVDPDLADLIAELTGLRGRDRLGHVEAERAAAAAARRLPRQGVVRLRGARPAARGARADDRLVPHRGARRRALRLEAGLREQDLGSRAGGTRPRGRRAARPRSPGRPGRREAPARARGAARPPRASGRDPRPGARARPRSRLPSVGRGRARR